MPFICPICTQKWRTGQKSIQCTSCSGWVHHNNKNNCSGLTNTEFTTHCNDSGKPWECDKCSSKSDITLPLPSTNLEDDSQNELSDDINLFNSLQVKNFIAQCDSIQKSMNLDDDDEIFSTQVNSKYYDINQLNSLKLDLPSTFGLFHVNIASLNKHIDDLRFILSQLEFNFDIIGISEHKILKDTVPSKNIKIAGYEEFIFEPTESTHGGTGFYIKDNLDYTSRKDLQINSPLNHESMFIEIIFPNKKNLIVGCIYRHSSKISVKDFTNEHLDPILQKIVLENKQCILMGDFNVDLLKCDTINNSNTFIIICPLTS